uniref:Uncharacterized protein n=1 Tax=Anopheles albimanus TaxID=7167 RepID=A0A182FCE7_ANOAL
MGSFHGCSQRERDVFSSGEPRHSARCQVRLGSGPGPKGGGQNFPQTNKEREAVVPSRRKRDSSDATDLSASPFTQIKLCDQQQMMAKAQQQQQQQQQQLPSANAYQHAGSPSSPDNS